MATITNPWPSWGETGESPSTGFFYEGGDQVNEKHLDYLWDQLDTTQENTEAALKHDGFSMANSGVVDNGDGKILYSTALADDETIKVTQASLIETDGTPIPTDCDLVIAVIAGSGTAGSKSTIITGDGTTRHDDQTGNPLDSYQNTSGGEQVVAIVVDNGNYNAGSGSDLDHIASVKGYTET